MKNVILYILGFIFACILTAAERCGVEWGA